MLASLEELTAEIRAVWNQPVQLGGGPRRFGNSFRWGILEGMTGFLISATLWLFIVAGADIQTMTYEVPIEVQNIAEGFSLNSVTPERVAVSLAGAKRNFFQVRADDLVIRLDGTLTRFGRQTFPITNAHLLLPPQIQIVDFAPDQVRVLVRKLE